MKVRREIKIGVVVLLALGLFIWGYNYLKGINLFSSSNNYYIVYDKVDGVEVNSPVKVNGFNVGQVREVYLHPNGKGQIIVKFAITDDAFKFPKKSTARIVSTNLLGGTAIQIYPALAGAQAVPGDTLIGEMEGSIKDEVNKAIAPLQKKTEQLFGSVDSVITIFRTVFNDTTRENLRRSFESVRLTIETLAHTTQQFDTLITGQKSHLASIIMNVEDITNNIKNNDVQLNRIINNIAIVTDSMVKADIVGAIKQAEEALKDFAAISKKINDGQGTMGLLINNDSLYRELNSSAKSLDALIKDLNENPERYVHFSIFGRKAKKGEAKKPD